jgi:hypothetical protein
MDLSRRALRVGVDKHRAARLAEGLGKFRSELVASDYFRALVGERLGKQSAGLPAEPIITPQRITIADDKRFVHSFQLSAISSQQSAFS